MRKLSGNEREQEGQKSRTRSMVDQAHPQRHCRTLAEEEEKLEKEGVTEINCCALTLTHQPPIASKKAQALLCCVCLDLGRNFIYCDCGNMDKHYWSSLQSCHFPPMKVLNTAFQAFEVCFKVRIVTVSVNTLIYCFLGQTIPMYLREVLNYFEAQEKK